jgi:F0F1-type ATP synthase assembly protein I
VRDPLTLTILVTLALGVGFGAAGGAGAAIAALYGGATAAVNPLLVRLHTVRARRVAMDAGRTLVLLYWCAIERMLSTVVLLAVGFGALDLAAVPLLVGFVAGVIGQVIGALTTRA